MKWPSNWPHPLILSVILLWGVNFPMVKLSYLDFSAPSVALLRYAMTIPCMFAMCIMLRSNLRLPKKYWLGVAFGGLVGSGIYMVLFLAGMHMTSPSQGAVALATAPIWVALMSALVGHEKVTAKMYAGSGLAFCGVALAIFGAQGLGQGSLIGTGICLVSAFVWGIQVILLRPAINDLDPFAVFAWSLPSAAVVMVPWGIRDVLAIHWSQITINGWTGLFYTSLISGVIGFSLYYKAVGIVGAAKTSMVSYFIPIVAAVAALPILGTPPHPMHLVGLAVVLAGVAVVTHKARAVSQDAISGTIEG